MAFFSKITQSKPLLLIGAGNMGGALLKGWLAAGLGEDAVIIIDPVGAVAIHQNLNLKAAKVFEDLSQMGEIPAPAVVVFAVKPQFMTDVFELGDHIPLANTLLLSIAAGTRISHFEKRFGEDTAIIRAMPNTPAAIAKGITALIGNAAAGEADLNLAEDLMGCVGKVLRVSSEDDLDTVTALSGSGPAYFFYMIEAMAAAGVDAGLAPDVAMTLARETFVGAARLLETSDLEAIELRRRVTSPGGTTEAALKILMSGDGLMKLMSQAILKAKTRGRELSS